MQQLTIRIDDEQLADVDATVALLSQHARGVKISRAEGLKTIITAGVDAIRSELGAEPKKSKH